MIMINVQSRIKYKVNFNKYLNIKLRSCVFVSGGKKSLLFKKYGMFCFLVTSVLSLTLFALLPTLYSFQKKSHTSRIGIINGKLIHESFENFLCFRFSNSPQGQRHFLIIWEEDSLRCGYQWHIQFLIKCRKRQAQVKAYYNFG